MDRQIIESIYQAFGKCNTKAESQHLYLLIKKFNTKWYNDRLTKLSMDNPWVKEDVSELDSAIDCPSIIERYEESRYEE